MRLLQVSPTGDYVFTEEFLDKIPAYAILSHTWGRREDEVLYTDIKDGSAKHRVGFEKLRLCGKQAAADGLAYFWVDTCCIDQANFTELHTAINSMYRWYENAARCYVYLPDVSAGPNVSDISTWEDGFRKSRWFTRGWTLQELIAPSSVEFFSREWARLGDKQYLRKQICDVTGIRAEVLQGQAPLSDCTVKERMSWSHKRQTKVEEDRAYCLLGIFDVSMPLVYGEGSHKAFRRLHEEIARLSSPRALSPSSERSLTEDEQQCVWQFRSFDVEDFKRLLPKPARGTCEWVLDHPVFQSWLKKTENAIFWLIGHPGCGKTTLASFLARYFDQSTNNTTQEKNVLVYYCDDKISQQKDANAIMSGLIFQLIQRHRSLVKHVRKAYELHGSSLIRSFSALWAIFRKILGLQTEPVYIVIDALDECEKGSRSQLLEAIHELLTDFTHPAHSRRRIKVLISSRPTLNRLYTVVDQAGHHQISLDEDLPGHSTDLQSYIQQRVEGICRSVKVPPDVRDFLLRMLYAKADRSFLWVHLTVSSIENSLLGSMRDFREIIGKVPPGLETVYSKFLSAIPAGHQNNASCLLELMLASSRPLRLGEINIAFTIEYSHLSTEDVTRDSQPDIARTVQGILGPLVRVSDSRIMLVHQSAKDFLLRSDSKGSGVPPTLAISPETSALRMSNSCILYLLLEEFDCDLYSVEEEASDYLSVGTPESLTDSAIGIWEDSLLSEEELFQEPFERDMDISRAIETRYELYGYASLHWAENFALCGQSASAELRQAAMSLLDVENASCRNWLRYYSANIATARDAALLTFHPVTLAAYFNLQPILNDLLYDVCGSAHQKAIDQGLFWAARMGHARVIATLLKAGADPNVRGPDRQTALLAATQYSHLDCINALLSDERTDANALDRSGRNALSLACGNGQENIVEQLLSKVPHTAHQADRFGTTPFFWATGGGYTPVIVRFLRQPGLEINHRDNTGRTVLSWAAGDGMQEVTKRLLKAKDVDVNLSDNEGRSPLIWAARNGCTGAVSVLTGDRRVNKASVDRNRRGAISWACAGGHAGALLQLIRSHCPGIDEEDVDGWTPLTWSIQTDSPGTTEALIASGHVDIERRDRDGRTALSWAVEYGHLSIVKVLLKAGADPASKSGRGTTPLMVAENFERPDMVAELLLYSHVK